MRDMRRGEAELLASGAPVGPRTYEVEIKADPVRFLDWDKPLIEQSPAVQNAVEPFAQSKWGDSGASLYRSSGLPRHPVAASRVLSEAGIPGIKYLDEGSRNLASNIAQADSIIAAGGVRGRGASSIDDWVKQKAEWQQTPQTSNYVVFNPDIVDIKKMYGFAGAPGAAAAAMGSTYDPSQYEVTP
jgi:hypothetical protein